MGWSTTLALLILALALAAWVAVQNAWRRSFPAAASGDPDVLVDIARRHGLKPDDVDRVLEDDVARQVVLTKEAQMRASGIAGVPGFLLNRRLLLVGAQDADNMVNAFDRAMFGEGADQLVSPALN